MDGPAWLIGWNFARNILGIFVGTAAIVGFAFLPLTLPMRMFAGAAAIAILIPASAFRGADVLDWIGLASAIGVLGFDFMRSRNGRSAIAAKVAERS
jgi:hypothetical protein